MEILITKCVFVLILAYLSVGILSKFLGVIAYYLLSQDKLDKPLFDTSSLSNKIFKPFIEAYVLTDCKGKWFLTELEGDKVYYNPHSSYKYACKGGIEKEGHSVYSKSDIVKEFGKTHKPTLFAVDKIAMFSVFILILLVAFSVDVILLAFASYPLATLSILGTVGTGVSIRFLSGKLWTLTAKKDEHETRITKLEESKDATD